MPAPPSTASSPPAISIRSLPSPVSMVLSSVEPVTTSSPDPVSMFSMLVSVAVKAPVTAPVPRFAVTGVAAAEAS